MSSPRIAKLSAYGTSFLKSPTNVSIININNANTTTNTCSTFAAQCSTSGPLTCKCVATGDQRRDQQADPELPKLIRLRDHYTPGARRTYSSTCHYERPLCKEWKFADNRKHPSAPGCGGRARRAIGLSEVMACLSWRKGHDELVDHGYGHTPLCLIQRFVQPLPSNDFMSNTNSDYIIGLLGTIADTI